MRERRFLECLLAFKIEYCSNREVPRNDGQQLEDRSKQIPLGFAVEQKSALCHDQNPIVHLRFSRSQSPICVV